MRWYENKDIKSLQERIEKLEEVKDWLTFECETDTRGYELGAIGGIEKVINDLHLACEIMASECEDSK